MKEEQETFSWLFRAKKERREGGREKGREDNVPQGMPLAEEDEPLQVRTEDDLIFGELGHGMKSYGEDPGEGWSNSGGIDGGREGGRGGGGGGRVRGRGGGGGGEGDEDGAVEGGVFLFAREKVNVGEDEVHQHVGHGGGDGCKEEGGRERGRKG